MYSSLEKLPTNVLRTRWSKAWEKEPPKRMGRTMLIKSLKYKVWESETGGVPEHVQKRLDNLIRRHKMSKQTKVKKRVLKLGTELVRIYNGNKHCVQMTERGLEYNGQVWSSLSAIANHIAGGSRNGWTFFGIE